LKPFSLDYDLIDKGIFLADWYAGAEARGGKQGPGPPLQYLPLQYFFFFCIG